MAKKKKAKKARRLPPPRLTRLRSFCSCPGAGHDPFTCKSTEGQCRVPIFGGLKICGLPKGHEGRHGPENPNW